MLVEPGPFKTDWSGRSAKEVENTLADYSSTAKVQGSMRGSSGNEPGDPHRAAQAIVTAVNADNPPLWLLLGAVAYHNALAKNEEMQTEFAAWKELSLRVDFNGV